MTVWEELKARGLIAQVTDEDEIKEMVNNGKATFYIGFDPTADSLHVGHFMALCLMKRLQMAGNRPIALLGGGTGMIGLSSASPRPFAVAEPIRRPVKDPGPAAIAIASRLFKSRFIISPISFNIGSKV